MQKSNDNFFESPFRSSKLKSNCPNIELYNISAGAE